jgi:hypothetical protein
MTQGSMPCLESTVFVVERRKEMSRKMLDGSQANGLRAAILRLLAATKSQETQRVVTVQDLAPAKSPGSQAQAGEGTTDSAASVEWSLRIMS